MKRTKAVKAFEKQQEAKFAMRRIDEARLRERTLTELNIKVYEQADRIFNAMLSQAVGDEATGRLPDWRAGEAIFNRAYGKPKESVDIRSANVNVDIAIEDKEQADAALQAIAHKWTK